LDSADLDFNSDSTLPIVETIAWKWALVVLAPGRLLVSVEFAEASTHFGSNTYGTRKIGEWHNGLINDIVEAEK